MTSPGIAGLWHGHIIDVLDIEELTRIGFTQLTKVFLHGLQSLSYFLYLSRGWSTLLLALEPGGLTDRSRCALNRDENDGSLCRLHFSRAELKVTRQEYDYHLVTCAKE